MIEVNRKMSWEELVKTYPGKVAYGKVLGRQLYNNIPLPVNMYVTVIPEYTEEACDLAAKKLGGELGEFSDIMSIPKIAYPEKGQDPYFGLPHTLPRKEDSLNVKAN